MAPSHDAQAAEDLVQGTLITALCAAEWFKGHSAVPMWLTGILKLKLSEHYRRKERRPGQPDSGNPDSRVDASGHRMKLPRRITTDRPENEADGTIELLGGLAVRREQLPPTLLGPLELREVQGPLIEAIYAALELLTSALWMRLHGAREALRNCLEKFA